MTQQKYNTHKEETAAVKKALTAAGINAEVGHGTGTAWAWLEINIGKGPHIHDIGDHSHCNFCERREEQITKKALQIAIEVTGRKGPNGGEILILNQNGWSKKHGSYAIEQTIDIEERNIHPELCQPRENQQNILFNTVQTPKVNSDVKQYLPTNSEQNNKTHTAEFAYRLESRRVADSDFPYGGQKIRDSQSAAQFVNNAIKDADAEKMIILYLDNQNKIIGVTYNTGVVNACSVYPGQITKTALLTGASGIIMLHNHPSGNLTASNEDKRLTYNTIAALNYVGLEVHDHIIYAGPDKYYSMADDGLIATYKQKITDNRRVTETLYDPPEVKPSRGIHF